MSEQIIRNKGEGTMMDDLISRQAAIEALHTWFRDGFDEDKWWNSTHVLAAIEGLPSVQQEHKWETCFECPLSHGCPKIKGCTNEQAIEYASQIPNDCPLSAQPVDKDINVPNNDVISRQAAIKAICEDGTWLESQGCTEITMAERKQRDADILGELPSAERKGKWINHRNDAGHNIADCSVCGSAIQWFDDDEKPRFCCMCGSRNKQEEKE